MMSSSGNGPVLLVEDDDTLRAATVQTLELAGLDVQPFDNATRAARYVTVGFKGCIITDIRMDGMDGLQLFARIMDIDRQIPVILVSGHGDIAMAVRAMHDGAFDFLAKPFAADHLAIAVRRALTSRQLVIDNRALRDALARSPDDIIAHSAVMVRLLKMADQIARTDLDHVIEGETGTGKELLARRIHRQSARHARPFITLPCGTLATEASLGSSVELATGGTLFLDGCDELTSTAQAMLVALLDERDRAAVDHKSIPSFRVVGSSVAALSSLQATERFRADLLHRLTSATLTIPPLRARREDIPPLFACFLRDALKQTGKKHFDMSASDRKRLLEHDWPGNARELRNYAFGAVLNLPRSELSPQPRSVKPLAARVGEFESMVITEALQSTAGNVVRACALLAIPRKTLYEKFAKYRIDPMAFRHSERERN